MVFATRMVRSFKSMDDKYKPEFFFEETKKERMRRHTVSYNYGRDTYKRIHWDLERKIMVLCLAKLAEHFEFYTTFVEVGKLSSRALTTVCVGGLGFLSGNLRLSP